MTEKERQDQAWASLSAEQRKKCRECYKRYAPQSAGAILTEIFGWSNLTSDAEPDELEHGLLQTSEKVEEPSVKDEPKYKVNDVVRTVFNEITHITAILGNGNYYLYGMRNEYPEDSLTLVTPYTEPTQTNDNMEEKEFDLFEILKGHEGEEIFLPDDGEVIIDSVSPDDYEVAVHVKDSNRKITLSLESLEITPSGFCYTYPSRESYLKYPLDAKQSWQEWQEEQKPKRWRAKDTGQATQEEVDDNIDAYLYWHFDRTYTPQEAEEMGTLEDDLRYESGNYFKTPELCQQAAEAVKATLEQFHKNHQQ